VREIIPFHDQHVEVRVDEPSRVIAFIDVATGKLNVQVYVGTRKPAETRDPVWAYPDDFQPLRIASEEEMRTRKSCPHGRKGLCGDCAGGKYRALQTYSDLCKHGRLNVGPGSCGECVQDNNE
jgi:hypothetical protein